MTRPSSTRAGSAGFTLIELMIAVVMVSIIMGATVAVMRSQSASFRTGGQRLELSQNLRYAVSTMDRVLRTAGAGAEAQQPLFVYGDSITVAVNVNYTSDIQDGSAVYINPDAPAGSFTVLPLASAYVLPNTAFTYPSTTYNDRNGTPGLAETIVFYFRPDSSTADVNDWVLMQKVNAMPAEQVARYLYQIPGQKFLEYFVHTQTFGPPSPKDSLQLSTLVPGMTPIRHVLAVHGSVGDTAGTPSAVADSVKMVRFNIRATNGLTGAAQRFLDVSSLVHLPNNGLIPLKTCGSTPLLAGPLLATPNAVGNPPSVTLTWNASVDEAGGEQDVTQYNVYQRLNGALTWGSPIGTVPAGQPNYTNTIAGLVALTSYDFAVGAQDCTPSESNLLTWIGIIPN